MKTNGPRTEKHVNHSALNPFISENRHGRDHGEPSSRAARGRQETELLDGEGSSPDRFGSVSLLNERCRPSVFAYHHHHHHHPTSASPPTAGELPTHSAADGSVPPGLQRHRGVFHGESQGGEAVRPAAEPVEQQVEVLGGFSYVHKLLGNGSVYLCICLFCVSYFITLVFLRLSSLRPQDLCTAPS